MYLIERLLGVALYLIVLLGTTYYIYHTKKLGKTLEIYAVILGVMAFFYEPAETADLYRIYEAMEYFTNMSWKKFCNEIVSTPTPAYLIYIRIIGKIGIKELLPAITAYIYYSNIFCVIKKCAFKYKVSNRSVSLVVLLLMSFGQFVQVISGIRSMLAFLIVVRCMYEEILENKRIIFNLWKYAIAFWLHPVGVAACGIRIFYEIFCYKSKNFLQLLAKGAGVLMTGILGLRFALPYIVSMLDKAEKYISGDIYGYIWEYIMAIVYLALIFYSLHKYKHYFEKNREIQSLVKLLKIMSFGVCIMILEYSIFQRFTVFISMLFLPIYIYILSKVEHAARKNEQYINIMIYCPIMILVLACVRGNLSGYKFFVLDM